MNNPIVCQHGQLARSCDRCADAAEIAELRMGVDLLAKCAMAAHEALKCRDRYGWSPEADAALELLRVTVPPMPFVPSEQPHALAARINELTLYAAGVEAERDSLRTQLAEARQDTDKLRATLAASCDEEREQLWEAGPGGGCSRALDAENENDKLRTQLAEARAEAEALRSLTYCGCGDQFSEHEPGRCAVLSLIHI